MQRLAAQEDKEAIIVVAHDQAVVAGRPWTTPPLRWTTLGSAQRRVRQMAVRLDRLGRALPRRSRNLTLGPAEQSQSVRPDRTRGAELEVGEGPRLVDCVGAGVDGGPRAGGGAGAVDS